MKKLILIPVILTMTIIACGQRSVDALFNKYSDSYGFTSITISGDLIKLVRSFEGDKDDDDRCWPADIATIRILAQKDEDIFDGNFYEMVERQLDRRNYEEFMRVKNAHQNMVMLVRADGRQFREFLIVAGGEDNALIQVKGNMTYKEAKKFAENLKRDHGVNIVISSR